MQPGMIPSRGADELRHELSKLEQSLHDNEPDALKLAYQLLNEARLLNMPDLIADVLYPIQQHHLNVTFNMDEGLAICNEAIKLLDERKDAFKLMLFYRDKALMHRFKGDSKNERISYHAALHCIGNLTEENDTIKRFKSSVYLNTANYYLSREYHKIGLQYLDMAYPLCRELGADMNTARCYIGYGGYYHHYLKQYDKSEEFYRKANAIFESKNYLRGIAVCNCNLAELKLLDHKYEEAEQLLQQAKEYTINDNPVHQINPLISLAKVRLRQGQTDDAEQIIKQADEIKSAHNTGWYETELLELKVELLTQRKDFQSALQLQKSLYNRLAEDTVIDRNNVFDDSFLLGHVSAIGKRDTDDPLSNKQIAEYARQLEISNMELRQFVHIASHDLKEPVRMIKLYMQLMQKKMAGHPDSELKEYFTFSMNNADRMMGLINSILSLSKITADVEYTKVDMTLLIEDVKNLLMDDILKKNVRFEFLELPVIICDRNYLMQLFQNLISNAIKYNLSPNPTIRIEHYEQVDIHHFSISDNGIGIPLEYRERVFDLFQRLHGREEFSGTGIGLAICRKIVKHLRGNIWVEDSLLGGARFCFTVAKVV